MTFFLASILTSAAFAADVSEFSYDLKRAELSARIITGDVFTGSNTAPYLAWTPYFKINPEWIVNLSAGYSPISSESGNISSWRGLVGAKYLGLSQQWSPEIQLGSETWVRTNTYSGFTYQANMHYHRADFAQPLFSQVLLDSIFVGYSGLQIGGGNYQQGLLGLRFKFGDAPVSEPKQELTQKTVVAEAPVILPQVKKVFAEIHFEQSQWKLSKKDHEVLNVVVSELKASPKQKIIIQGHANSDGSDLQNKIISKSRAESVRRYLLQQSIAKNRMKTEFFGSSRPIKSSDSQKLSRRVEIHTLVGGERE